MYLGSAIWFYNCPLNSIYQSYNNSSCNSEEEIMHTLHENFGTLFNTDEESCLMTFQELIRLPGFNFPRHSLVSLS